MSVAWHRRRRKRNRFNAAFFAKAIGTDVVALIGKTTAGGDFDLAMTPTGLTEIAAYADGIGPHFGFVLNEDGSPTALVEQAHGVGLKVHPWTLRIENSFLPLRFRRPGGDGDEGCYNKLYDALKNANVDGVFTDNIAEVVALADQTWTGWCANDKQGSS